MFVMKDEGRTTKDEGGLPGNSSMASFVNLCMVQSKLTTRLSWTMT
jgi:hypothetical protein